MHQSGFHLLSLLRNAQHSRRNGWCLSPVFWSGLFDAEVINRPENGDIYASFLRLQKCLKNDSIIWKLSSAFCSPSNAVSKLMFLRRFQTPLITGHAMSHQGFKV